MIVSLSFRYGCAVFSLTKCIFESLLKRQWRKEPCRVGMHMVILLCFFDLSIGMCCYSSIFGKCTPESFKKINGVKLALKIELKLVFLGMYVFKGVTSFRGTRCVFLNLLR